MNKNYAIVNMSASAVAGAIDRTVRDYAEGLISDEPSFTSRMLGRIAEAMQGFVAKGVVWKARVLTSMGPGTEEKVYGADFMGVLDITLPDFRVQKGFLAQAKVQCRHIDVKRLQAQCKDMLRLSPASFVFLYSKEAVRVVPAIAVCDGGAPSSQTSGLSANSMLANAYDRSARRFFEEHFTCFIGDGRIAAPTAATLDQLDRLRQLHEARALLYLEATELPKDQPATCGTL